jgi:hypothetical protein
MSHDKWGPDCVAAFAEVAWTKVRNRPKHMGPVEVGVTPMGKVCVGWELNQHMRVEVAGIYDHRVSLEDLTADVFDAWQALQE